MKRSFLVVLMLTLACSALAVTPGTDLYLPSVGHAQGSCPGGICSQWRSDAWVFNPDTTKPAAVTIYFLQRGESNPTPTTVGPITIAPGETKELVDLVLNTFGKNGYGALRFVSDNPVLVTGRVYDENVVTNKGAGTAGQFFAGLPAQQAIASGQSTEIIGLAQDSAGVWRTNFGFVETTGNAASVLVELIAGDATVLATWTPGGADAVGGYGAQQFSITKIPNAPPGVNLRLRVSVTSGSGKVLAFGSRVDNRTGDPSTVEMLMTPATSNCPAIPTSGLFDGTVLAQDGVAPNGGVRLVVGETAITSLAVLSGVPCPSDSTGVLVDFSSANLVLDATGHFATTLAAQAYAAGDGSTAFSTVWTISGGRNADGSFSGTLTSVTSGGTNKAEFNYAQCNGTTSDRAWHAGFMGSGGT
jgi:hypothetical protein